jgi:hypothetical protein
MAKSDIKSEAEHQRHEMSDPVLLMLGIGKHLWTRESGDRFVERLRSEDVPPPFEVGWTPRRANNRRLELRSAPDTDPRP